MANIRSVIASWFRPTSKDKEQAFRERLVRFCLAIIMFNISFSLIFSLIHTGDLLQNLIIHVPILAIECFAIFMLGRGHINLAGQMLVLQIIVAQVAYMIYTRYSHNALSFLMGPLSLIFAVLLTAALLPPRQIIPFTILIVACLMAAVFYPIEPAWDVIDEYDPWVFGIWSAFILMAEGVALSKLMQESERRYYNEQKANQAKSEFLRHINHELRTPLNSITPLTQMMLDGRAGELAAKQRQYLVRIKNGTDYLHSLVRNILNFAKMEAGEIQPELQLVQANELIEAALQVIAFDLTPGIQIIRELGDIPCIQADPNLLSEVFVNILDNAAKFTDKGYIRVKTSSSEAFIHIEIQDTGIGISDESKVFEQFGQTLEGKSKHGSGLGMPLAKSLVELHQGKIWFRSMSGLGTIFYVDLPRGNS